MSILNPTGTTSRDKDAHLNWMGGPSWDLSDPVFALRLAAASCFFGEPMYYHRDGKDKRPTHRSLHQQAAELSDSQLDYLRDTLGAADPREWRGLAPADLMVRAIDRALEADPERTLQVAAALRTEDNIRVTPQVILVRAANTEAVKGTGLIRRFGRQIIKRADEPATGIAYQLAAYGKPIPNSLKRAWAEAMERFTEYGLAKYRLGDRAVKAVDVANLVHPASDKVDKLMRGELKVTEAWEAQISSKGSTTQSWTEVLPFLTRPEGHMALLRNVRNLVGHKVPMDLWVPKLVDGVENGKQLPFRYYSAWKANAGAPGPVLDAIEACLVRSFEHSPHFAGRTMSLCDNSGSAWGTTTSSMGTMHVAQIANLTAVITGMASDEGYVGVFGDNLETFAVRRSASVFDQVEKADSLGHGIGSGTENGVWLFWDQAIRDKEHWDRVFVYSDMQAGHGGLYGTNPSQYYEFTWDHRYIDVPKLVSTYRAKVNPNVQVFLVQVAGYQDTIMPEFYKKTYILGGWGDGILRFAAAMEGLPQQ